MEIKAVVFDLDDTIINTTQMILAWHSGAYQQFKRYLGRINQGVFNEAVELSVKEAFTGNQPVYQASIDLWFRTFRRLEIEPVPNLVFGLYTDLQKYTAENCRLEPGFKELYEQLKKERIRVGILSNGGFWEKGVKIKGVGLGDEPIAVVSTDMVGVDKPDKRAFRYILEIMEVKPSETVMVGDSYKADYLGAKRAGMKAIWYVSRTRGMKLEDHRIKFRVTGHDQVWEQLSRMRVEK